MNQKLTDFSQLSKAMFKVVPKDEAAKVAQSDAKSQDDGKEALEYFSRSPKDSSLASEVKAEDPTEVLKKENAALSEKLDRSEKARLVVESKLAAAERELERLKGECGRLRGEMLKADSSAQKTPDAEEEPSADLPVESKNSPMMLSLPESFDEIFAGEMREMVIAALSDAWDSAKQSSRERRAAILEAVLAINQPSGELERRRAELTQAFKDCGYYTDPKSIEKLGFRIVSGRNHWKLEYGNVRIPIAKTPSDFRAARNATHDIAKRCL